MAPPLRSEADREAVRDALADGTIDAIATDHAPHSTLEKDVEFDQAAIGMVGLETALGLGLALVDDKAADAADADRAAHGRRRAASSGSPRGTLAVGAPGRRRPSSISTRAGRWIPRRFASKSRNSPFARLGGARAGARTPSSAGASCTGAASMA